MVGSNAYFSRPTLLIRMPTTGSRTKDGRPRLLIGSLSNSVLERRKSTGSERFSLLICIDATKFVLLSVFTLIESICPKICSKSRLKGTKKQLPVDFRRSKTLLLKLPNTKVRGKVNFIFYKLNLFPIFLVDKVKKNKTDKLSFVGS